MNKTINIHLAKMPFTLDEKAYYRLKKYLDQLNVLFEKTEGKEEILEDIEVRIAELFAEHKQQKEEIITDEIVRAVIDTLGAPEEFVDETEQEKNAQPLRTRKLYRDTDDRFIGGVAGGMSHYFGIESVWIRLLFLLLLFSSIGGIVFIYILLWILIPEAVTTADKLKMRGEPVNVGNIKKKIKEELDQVSDTVKGVDYENLGDKVKEKSKTIFDLGLKGLNIMLKLIRVVVGVLLIFWSSMSIIALIISVFIGTIFTSFIPHELLTQSTTYDIPLPILITTIVLLAGIPFVFLFSLGSRLLSYRKNIMGRSTQLFLGGIWFVALLAIITLAIIESESKAITFETRNQQSWASQPQDTLRLQRNNPIEAAETTTYFNDERIITKDGQQFRFGDRIRLNIVQNTNDSIQLVTIKSAKAWSQDKAQFRAENIEHEVDFYDGTFLIDQYWRTALENKSAGQKIKLRLKIPEGKYVWIDDEWAKYLDRKIPNDQNYSRYNLAGHLWKMEDKQLVCHDCKHFEGAAKIDENGVEMDIKNRGNTKSIHVNLNEDGLQITTEEKEK